MKYLMAKAGELVAGLDNVCGVRFYPAVTNKPVVKLDGYTDDLLVVDFEDDEENDIEIPSKMYRLSITRQQFEFYK